MYHAHCGTKRLPFWSSDKIIPFTGKSVTTLNCLLLYLPYKEGSKETKTIVRLAATKKNQYILNPFTMTCMKMSGHWFRMDVRGYGEGHVCWASTNTGFTIA